MESRGGRPTKGESENDAESHGVNTEIWRTQGDARKENGGKELKDETTKEKKWISYRKENKIGKVGKYI